MLPYTDKKVPRPGSVLYFTAWNVRLSSWNVRLSTWNIRLTTWNIKFPGLWKLFLRVSAGFLWEACGISLGCLQVFFGAPATFLLSSWGISLGLLQHFFWPPSIFSSEWNFPKNLVLRLFFRKFAVKNSGYAKTQDVLCGPDAFGPPKWQKSILWKEKFQFHTIKGARSTLFKAEWENCSG